VEVSHEILAEYMLMQSLEEGWDRRMGAASLPTPPEAGTPAPPELGGPAGPEPTRFGDWERRGRCIDF
jgi:hypothetical protein